MESKTLYLVRHAKSSWKDPSLTDQQRPLNTRGLKNAPEMAHRLRDASRNVDKIISSSAERARSTALYMAQGLNYDIDNIKHNDHLYFGGIQSMLDVINHSEQSVGSLMLVGHNPDLTSLFNYLCGNQTYNMPTCAIAIIHFDCDWSSVDRGTGTVIDYDFPKRGLK